MYWLGRENRFVALDEMAPVSEALWALADLGSDARDKRSILAYLRDLELPDWMISMAEASYANTCGGPLADLSLRGVVDLEHGWEFDGEHDFRCEGYSMGHLMNVLASTVKCEMHMNSPVHEISRNGHHIQVTGVDGTSREADVVVVTLPVAVLAAKTVEFSPPLPPAKQSAIQDIGVRAATKVRFVGGRGCVCVRVINSHG